MHLKFDVTLDDYVEYSYYTLWARPEKRRKRLIYNWGLPILLIELLVLRYLLHDENFFLQGAVAGIFLLALSLRIYYSRWGMRKYYLSVLKRDPKRFMMGERELDLDQNEVVFSVSGATSSLAWSLLTCLRETEQYLFLHLNKSQAIIIPKRIFLLEQELYDVRSFIEQRITPKS